MKIILSIFVALVPVSTFAAQTIQNLTSQLLSFASGIPMLLTLAALIWFMYQVVLWVGAEGDDKKKKAKDAAWGLLALFVMLSVWGLVALIQNSLQIGGGRALDGSFVPGVQVPVYKR